IGTRIASYHSSANPVAQGLARLVNAKTVVRYCPGDHVQICRDVYACDAVYDWLRGATENGAPFVSEFV
ncbi:MAG TPA: hypothetical protein VHT28_10210, partial [Silvibacterium sp.]|nr:hypothetical protein [Silvibacterium sp.]